MTPEQREKQRRIDLLDATCVDDKIKELNEQYKKPLDKH